MQGMRLSGQFGNNESWMLFWDAIYPQETFPLLAYLSPLTARLCKYYQDYKYKTMPRLYVDGVKLR